MTESAAATRKKVLAEAEKGPARSRTVRLKSKILIAASQPLSGSGIRRPQPVETLFAVSRAVGSRMDITEVLRQTTRELVRALAADFGSVWRVNPEDRELSAVAGYRVPARVRSICASDHFSAPFPTKATIDISRAVYSSESEARGRASRAKFTTSSAKRLPV